MQLIATAVQAATAQGAFAALQQLDQQGQRYLLTAPGADRRVQQRRL